MREFSLLIKPASYHCNLRCRYCFYLSKEELFGKGNKFMSMETFEDLVKNFYSCDMEQYAFAYQGGEPTLMGMDFFREAVKIQRKHLPEGKRFTNSLQTNGTLITNEMAKFFTKNEFLIGISVDGPRKIHNTHRLNVKGGGSYDEVIAGLNNMKKNNTQFNTLTLLSSSNIKYPKDVYNHLCELGSNFHQYIECIEKDENGQFRNESLKPGQWGEFMCKVFDMWYPNDIHRVSIRLFDSIVSRLLSGRPTMCTMGGNCCNYFVVEANGNIYPCDFYVKEELALGHVSTTNFAEALENKTYCDFGDLKRPTSKDCDRCRYLALCMGDCLKNRIGNTKSNMCLDWLMFYDHTIERFEQIVENLRRTMNLPR